MPSIRDKIAGKKSKLAIVKEKNKEHPADLNDYQEGSFYNVPVNQIKPNPYQPRQYFNPQTLKELSQSIKEKGVLQPIIIRRDKDGSIFLAAGERRLRASKKAGLEEIPAVLTKGNPAEIALIENVQRENLNPIEEAEAFSQMMDEFDYTQEKLAQIIGKSRISVTETLSLNKLPEDIKNECRRGDIYPKRLLRVIARQKTPNTMLILFNKAKQANFKSDRLKEIIRQKKRTPVAIASDRLLQLQNTIDKLDLDSAEEDDKVQFLTRLKQLLEIAKKFLV